MITSIENNFSKLTNRHYFLADVIIFSFTPIIALTLRIENVGEISLYTSSLIFLIPIYEIIKLSIFYFLGLYKRVWRYASIEEYTRIILAGFFVLILQLSVTEIFQKYVFWITPTLPRSVPIIDAILAIGFFGTLRYSVRILNLIRQRTTRDINANPVIIVGAGAAGVRIVKEIQSNLKVNLIPIAFVDDDVNKVGSRISGISVEGTTKDLAALVARFNAKDVIIALPSAHGDFIREIFNTCRSLDVKTRLLPSLNELIDGSITVKSLRSVRIEDILRRDPVKIDLESVRDFIKYKRVLVTGGGGSIGSELCRQVTKFSPSSLTIVGHGENSIFEIQDELLRNNNSIKLNCVIADIRDYRRLDQIFKQHNPAIIFHAAAHKHVPLMEENPSEAITNNILGTLNLCELSVKHKVNHLVLISSDKAVNPTSVMGTTKRIAELIVKHYAAHFQKAFLAVRFGNVLDSRGSVVPTFKKQIENGGPITVTHPEIKRYFMTIPEAALLVMQAASLGKGGEIFLLDMGRPVKIIDLAKDLIKLSGVNENMIDIVYTGLRPGEKLFEELVLDGETTEKTIHEKIFVSKDGNNSREYLRLNKPDVATINRQFSVFRKRIDDLIRLSADGDRERILNELKKIVPEFHRRQGETPK
jgi:FlaA1/EpsC-like NDP-sugar epimerase